MKVEKLKNNNGQNYYKTKNRIYCNLLQED